MKKCLMFEIRRAFRSKVFWTALAINLFICLVGKIFFVKGIHKTVRYVTAYKAWIGFEFTLPYSRILVTVFPLLASIPFAGSYFQDVNSGYMKNICLKCSRKQYYITKHIAIFLSAMAAITIPMLIDLYISMGMYPLREPENLEAIVPAVGETAVFSSLYAKKVLWYCIAYSFFSGMFLGLFSTLCVMISEIVESAFAAICLPFLCYLFSGVFFSGMIDNGFHWALIGIIDPINSVQATWFNVVPYLLLLLVLTIVWTWYKIKKKDVL